MMMYQFTLSCSLVFHAIQGVYEGTSVSKLYRESNTHELYGKYGAYVKPCRSIRKHFVEELVRV